MSGGQFNDFQRCQYDGDTCVVEMLLSKFTSKHMV